MSDGLATTRRTVRLDWRSTSAIQSMRNGSAVATTTSFGSTCTGSTLWRSAYPALMVSATLPTSTLSGSMRR
ncbi:hypothetical protein D9M68_966000 [compost metagenome]